MILPALFSFIKIVLAVHSLLWFHKNFIIGFPISVKHTIEQANRTSSFHYGWFLKVYPVLFWRGWGWGIHFLISYFLLPSLLVSMHYIKQPLLPEYMDWPCTGGDPPVCPGSDSGASQNFVLVHPVFFVPCRPQAPRVCQVISVQVRQVRNHFLGQH